ncbi:putative sugar-phosphate nucleotidyltransferase [Candidatus Nitrososphaera gargensis Ga9.2]|uniref:Putative sugar-phosphate nucleotidyltransferase n=2 Tax=Candidatus Nitrososphaera gargensis TaxID=497727 RepID=K0IIR4_NITGG|nr:putative sugar-phosphate nucleotidyltransferase [Candidatus Nitrososphaera gargensis Ga9.2]
MCGSFDLIIVFKEAPHHLSKMTTQDACSFSVMGKPLVLYNIAKLASRKSIDGVLFPEGYTHVANVISASYPSMRVDEYKDKAFISATGDLLELPLNSIIVESSMGDLVADQMMYPWDLLRIMNKVLESEVKTTLISPNATICRSSIISGPCIIEDGTFIDDFCKIKGPIYIGKNSKVGTGSLLRNCMVGSESSIGFNCEIGRSYLAGKNKIAHHNVILDSIIGEGTWMGGYVGTTNVLLNSKNVKYKVGDQLIDTGLHHFGAVIGTNCMIGAGVIVLPGRYIPSNSAIQAGTIVSK